MAPNVPFVRLCLYFALGIFSATLFGLCSARIAFTTFLSPESTQNNGVSFFEPVAVELWAASFLSLVWSIFAATVLWRRSEIPWISSYISEFIALLILWVLWVAGASVATPMWGNPSLCGVRELRCQLLTALVAFSWIGWGILTLIFGLTLMFCLLTSTLSAYFHGINVRPKQKFVIDEEKRANIYPASAGIAFTESVVNLPPPPPVERSPERFPELPLQPVRFNPALQPPPVVVPPPPNPGALYPQSAGIAY